MTAEPVAKAKDFPVVCVGGSAGLIAVIVSEYDGDVAAALCGIKEVGGITIAQKLDTTAVPDMPERAIASGCVDFILSPENIAKEIMRIAHAETAP